jgi:ssDNA-binding Zn-finger/Zn-ribbon topoisomerase 1
MYYTKLKKFPSAYITTGKQRLKQNGSNVYLNNGEEFEVEIFNPKSISVLAKIKINGNNLSGGGIIIKPGQRVFLERYLNEAKKFKFEVYEVNSSSKEVQEAIQNNGEVVVEFYDENVYLTNPIMTLAGGANSTWTNDKWHGDINTITTGTYSINWGGNAKYYNTNVSLTSNSNTFAGDSNAFYTNDSYNTNSSQNLKKSLQTDRFKETGRIEKGSDSKQEFESVDMNFNTFPSNYSTWRILPLSEKPLTATEVNITHCSNCGTKIKKSSWKFCPQCGKQMVRTKTEIHYTMDTKVSIDGKHYFMVTYSDTLDNFLKKNENKLIYIKSDSLTSNSLRAIIID